MSVQTVEVCVHVEMQLQLIYDLNTANTRFTIISYKVVFKDSFSVKETTVNKLSRRKMVVMNLLKEKKLNLSFF
jgi:hypothetical protein